MIKLRRRQLNWTLEQLAEKAQISVSFLGHIERGTRVASVERLIRLGKVLDVSLDWMIGTQPSLGTVFLNYSGIQIEQAKELLLCALRLIEK